MKKILAVFFLIIGFSFLAGCNNSNNNSKSCYDTEEEAWQACNNKYNGKCKFLGSSYKVCSNLNIDETKIDQPLAYTADCTASMDDDPEDKIKFEITVGNNTLIRHSGFGVTTARFKGKTDASFLYCDKCGEEDEFEIYLGEVKDGSVTYSDGVRSDGSSGSCILR